MAKYKITLEFDTAVSVNGTRVKSETTRSTQIIEGDFADVAKVMFEHETNCIKHNRLPKLTKDVYTVFESKDYRLYMHSRLVGHWAKVDVLDVNGKPVERI